MTEDYYFWSHRLSIARAAQNAGFDVSVATHVVEYQEKLQQEGFRVFRTLFSRSNRNLFNQVQALLELITVFRQFKPDIVHNVALKAVVFGTIAAWVARVPRVINLVAGLGAIFTDERLKYRLVSKAARWIAYVLFSRSSVKVVVQNSDDLQEIRKMAPRAQLVLIRGSGIDIHEYTVIKEPDGPIRVSLVGRMLWHKGVREFVEASRLLQVWGLNIEMVLVGGIDTGNLASLSSEQLLQWQSDGLVQWLGHQKNIAQIWSKTHIAVLPSYREGLPRSLLEAAACGRPIIAADTPGCREIVQHGHNGLLVPAKSTEELAHAIQSLAGDADLRTKMGHHGRELVCREFSNEFMIQKTLKVYDECL